MRSKVKNALEIEALRAQVQRIAFDANLFDRGIADYPYARECSLKRKRFLAEIEKLEGGAVVMKLPRRKVVRRNDEQLSFLK